MDVLTALEFFVSTRMPQLEMPEEPEKKAREMEVRRGRSATRGEAQSGKRSSEPFSTSILELDCWLAYIEDGHHVYGRPSVVSSFDQSRRLTQFEIVPPPTAGACCFGEKAEEDRLLIPWARLNLVSGS